MFTVAKALQEEMHKRFDKYIDASSECFNGLQLVATLLDPEYTYILSDDQVKEATLSLKEMVTSFSSLFTKSTDHNEDASTSAEVTEDQIKEPPPPLTKFRHLSKIISKQLSKKMIICQVAQGEKKFIYTLSKEKAALHTQQML